MTRKRYIKLLMSDGLSVRQARAEAEQTRREGQSYATSWVNRKISIPAEQTLSRAAEIAAQVARDALAAAAETMGAAFAALWDQLKLSAEILRKGRTLHDALEENHLGSIGR